MNNCVYIEFLVEDTSGKILLEHIMKKYVITYPNVMYKINSFKGIGHLPKNSLKKTSDIKTQKLLNDLPAYLRGLNNYLTNLPYKKAIIVVVDNDDKDFKTFKNELYSMCAELELKVDTFFCIAIEEMEAWLLGDTQAVMNAFPNAKSQQLQNYEPDTIIGTWEYLANTIYNGGIRKLKKNATSYYEIGEQKCKWANEIGDNLNLSDNRSPSFNYFLSKLDYLCKQPSQN